VTGKTLNVVLTRVIATQNYCLLLLSSNISTVPTDIHILLHPKSDSMHACMHAQVLCIVHTNQ